MKSSKKFINFLIITIIIVITIYNSINSYILFKTKETFSDNDIELIRLRKRLESLEPLKPMTIKKYKLNNLNLPKNTYDLNTILKKGEKLTLDYAYTNDSFIRQSYLYYWHSSYNEKYSYLPLRVEYAYHRIFTSYSNNSSYEYLLFNLGIWDEKEYFNIKNSNEYIILFVFQSKVKEIYSYENQIVVVAEPRRNGLEIINIPINKIYPNNKNDSIMFQLLTPEGFEIDYSLINFYEN